MSTEFNTIQKIKRRFFALRNGVIADYMRKSGAPYRIVFGLILPQISEIASEFGPDAGLARELRGNSSTRESLLLAPMLMPPAELTQEEATEWLEGAASAEVIDVLCLKLLKKLPFAPGIAQKMMKKEAPLARYAALRLSFNLLPQDMDTAEEFAHQELSRNEPLTRGVARQLIDEIEFLKEG